MKLVKDVNNVNLKIQIKIFHANMLENIKIVATLFILSSTIFHLHYVEMFLSFRTGYLFGKTV